jgi:hypothetical protein
MAQTRHVGNEHRAQLEAHRLAPCTQCSIGDGKRRTPNYALWLVVLGDGTVELGCDRHARMACRHPRSFAVSLMVPVMTRATLDETLDESERG